MKKIAITIILITSLILVNHKSNAQVVINEILSTNTNTNIDPYTNNFSDWIELHNCTDQDISVANWYLSDKKKKPTKWRIPVNSIVKAKDFFLIWTDGLDTMNHSNFKLDAKGESIFLFNPDTILIDSLSYPKQVTDVSYGRGTEGQLLYLQKATPSKKNTVKGIDNIIFSDRPKFSKDAGIYKESFELILSASSESDKIYYTLDGSVPTKKSVLFVEPIKITENTVIRARNYSMDKLAGEVITKTFLINESSTLPIVSLAMEPSHLWDKNIGIYVDGANFNPDIWESANYFQKWERPVHVEYFESNGSLGFTMEGGTRIHGRSTRRNDQKTLAIFAKEKYGSKEVPYKFFGDKSADKTKSFLLRNGGNDWGMTMLLDGLVHTLVMDKMDIDAQRYQPAIVFINGEYWGIHNIREKINEHYIKNKHKVKKTKLDIIEADVMKGELVASYGNMDDYNKLLQFIETNSLSIPENYEKVTEWIDIDEFLSYLVVEVYIRNKDWPGSNMKFWKERSENGKWRWILYDTELSFQEKNVDTRFNIIEHMLSDDPNYKTPLWSNLLIRKLFENEEFRNDFIQKSAIYMHTVFDSEHIYSVLDSLKRNIEPEMDRHLKKWAGRRQKAVPYLLTAGSKGEWEANISFLKRFIEYRPALVQEMMMDHFNIKDTVIVEIKCNNSLGGRISVMGYELENNSFKGKVFKDIPLRLEAIPNEGYEFIKWRGGCDEQNCVIRLKSNRRLTAVFKKIE